MTDKNLEFRGRTLEEAIERAMIELSVPRERLEIHVVAEGTPSTSSLHTSDAIVRVSVIPSATPAAVPAAATESVEPRTFAQQTLQTILKDMGFDAEVNVQPDANDPTSDGFTLDIVGRDLGVLIGRRGETLRDLEFLTRLIVSTKLNHQVMFNVDVEGYRGRREHILRELAKRMAERVKQNHQPITLEAMPPNERRVVHMTLRDSDSVRTESIGEGEHRRVMILPKG